MADNQNAAQVYKGIGVGRGAVAGPVVRANPAPVAPADAPPPQNLDAAATQLTDALAAVSHELQQRSEQATGTLAAVLGAAAEIAADPELADQAVEKVQGGTDPAVAITAVCKDFADMFLAAGGYMAERVTDLNSVRDRVVARLLGLPEPGVPGLKKPSIIVAQDLSPADTGALDLRNVLGIVLEQGGPTSHTAIIAGQLGLPCIVRVPGAAFLKDDDEVALDAARGTVTVNPDADTLAAVAGRQKALEALTEDKSDGATSDGHKIQLLANIGTAEDAERLTNEAVEGVGLFRTEVLFLDAQTAPTEKDQTAVYERTLNALGDRKVVIRTIDAGADKPLAFATQPNEENPALGIRAYRLNRIMPELLDTQLKAIAAAAKQSGHEPWVMAPMIATVTEAKDFAEAAHADGIQKAGVMIEIPSAAIKAKEILEQVDFVSIGSNDLAQYTQAADRLSGDLADLLDMWQPGTLFLVNRTAEAGLATGKPVGVCGESAADPLMALALTGMGITSLSMAPKAVPAVRFALANHTFAECQEIAKAALSADTAAEGRAAALALVKPEVREALVLEK
ncbi:MAG: phosphoenolpyruvate--protein phosphotransferase [Cellulomonadaceae bacterium]|jgi:phosphotransferase system enzyme I (PtsI)|nr:phosphoenolpyruvate--protein phosphotransferase [Cellulomonadaceae bacterium]